MIVNANYQWYAIGTVDLVVHNYNNNHCYLELYLHSTCNILHISRYMPGHKLYFITRVTLGVAVLTQ